MAAVKKLAVTQPFFNTDTSFYSILHFAVCQRLRWPFLLTVKLQIFLWKRCLPISNTFMVHTQINEKLTELSVTTGYRIYNKVKQLILIETTVLSLLLYRNRFIFSKRV